MEAGAPGGAKKSILTNDNNDSNVSLKKLTKLPGRYVMCNLNRTCRYFFLITPIASFDCL